MNQNQHSLRVALRRSLRAARRAITGHRRKAAAQSIAHSIEAAGWLQAGRHIGLFLSMPEELDTTTLLALARRRGCRICLPRVVNKHRNRMRFFYLDGGIRRGAFGIAEPQGTRPCPARNMDIVFVPLVGFDSNGNRMGMGRGFYDRHFAYRLHHPQLRRPLLVGIAYDVQCVPSLPAAKHDVPLDAIVTESTLRRFRRSST
jgi:5-formyltetrahydrofolate cyclo-ligase